jgi:hypothetical protein
VDLSKVDELGFADLLPCNGHRVLAAAQNSDFVVRGTLPAVRFLLLRVFGGAF